MRGRLAALALLAGACTVPTLAEIEAEQPHACSDERVCAEGYECFAGICRALEGTACKSGSVVACGSNVGRCRMGTRRCEGGVFGPCDGEQPPSDEQCNGEDDDCDGNVDEEAHGEVCALTQGVCAGRRAACVGGVPDAPCTAASYGPDYEASETRCDGLDNDCDGELDEALVTSCPNQQGVCEGSQVSCADGGFPECGPAVYGSFRPEYETFETRCDGLDNDCDGNADAWSTASISEGGAGTARSAAVVALPGAAPRTLLALYEDGTKISARSLRPDGSLGPVQVPSVSVLGATRAYAPVLAADVSVIAAAWIEEAGAVKRVMLATLDGEGRSTLSGASAMNVYSGAPVRLAIAVDAAAGRLLVAIEDSSASPPSAIKVVGYPTVLPPPLGADFTQQVAASGATRPHVAAGEGGAFYVAWETAAGIQRCTVDDAGVVSPRTPVGVPGDRNPVVFALGTGNPRASVVYFIRNQGVADVLAAAECQDVGDLCGAVETFPETSGPAMGELQLAAAARFARPVVATWIEDNGGPVVRYRLTDPTGAVPAVGTASQAGAIARRPAPALWAPGGAAILFDTEGNTGGGVAPDQVFIQRLCLP